MLIDNLKQIFTKSLPNWIDKQSVLLGWIKSAVGELSDQAESYTNEVDFTAGSKKAKSNWLENQSIYVHETNIPTHDTRSHLTTLIRRGTPLGFIELAYYLDNNAGSFASAPPEYTQTQTPSSMTWSGSHVDITIFKTTLDTPSNHFWIADTTSPGDARIQHATTDYVGPSVSHVLVHIKLNYLDQPSEDTKTFISKHFIPAGLPVIFI